MLTSSTNYKDNHNYISVHTSRQYCSLQFCFLLLWIHKLRMNF